jgi:hypothetical protein
MHAKPSRWSDRTDTLDRRTFLKTAAATVALPLLASATPAAPKPSSPPETAVKALFDSLTDEQRKVVCFDWDYKDQRGLLRTYVSNNWMITKPNIRSDFYTKQQQGIVFDIWKGLLNPEWHTRLQKQLRDDTRGQPWGAEQTLAIFGKPGSDRFEFVMTGRHMTLRADGNTQAHVAFGGPIFYGHAASGFVEKVGHPNNVFWPQARQANFVYQILDGKQRDKALLTEATLPPESAVAFRKDIPGIPVAELTDDQKREVQRVLAGLLDPFRKDDQDEAVAALNKQGGLDKCNLMFWKAGDLGDDGEWDSWRLEGPAFVWNFRGTPHVHVWVNVAEDPSVPLNARG